jgi:hypothetical protein
VIYSWSSRLTGCLVITGVAGLGAWLAIENLVGGDVWNAIRIATASVALGAAVYEVLVRPEVRVSDAGALLINPLRSVFIPWSTLEETDTSSGLELITSDRRYRTWAVSVGPRGAGAWLAGRGMVADNPLGAPSGMGRGMSPAMREVFDRAPGVHRSAATEAKLMIDHRWQSWQGAGHDGRDSRAEASHVTASWHRWCLASAAVGAAVWIIVSLFAQ